MYLIFDTETTGVPISYDAPASDVKNWPRSVQIAWVTFDRRGTKTGARSYVIRPNGYVIPRDAERVHRISTAKALRVGVPVSKVLNELSEALDDASVMVAHNLNFDAGVLGAEFYRLGVRHPFRGKHQVCTMTESTEYCALPGAYGPKWPKLHELHLKLFGKELKETHDAARDTAACAKCFFELLRLRVIGIPKVKRR